MRRVELARFGFVAAAHDSESTLDASLERALALARLYSRIFVGLAPIVLVGSMADAPLPEEAPPLPDAPLPDEPPPSADIPVSSRAAGKRKAVEIEEDDEDEDSDFADDGEEPVWRPDDGAPPLPDEEPPPLPDEPVPETAPEDEKPAEPLSGAIKKGEWTAVWSPQCVGLEDRVVVCAGTARPCLR